MVKRIFVEKKQGFDVAAANLLADIKENLGIALDSLRILNRYDIEGLDGEDFEKAKSTIFSEPNTDIVYDEELITDGKATVMAVEYLPGQYDQRADSAAQCVALLTRGERPRVQNARVYVISGKLTQDDIGAIQNYLINPVDSRLASLEKPESLDLKLSIPDSVETVSGFIDYGEDEIAKYWEKMGFAMTTADLAFCRDYFRDVEHRDPTITELKVIDTYWSDHCRHTTFLTRLEKIEVEEGKYKAAVEKAISDYMDARREVYGSRNKDICLMDMATMGARLLKKRGLIPDLDESEEINACSIEAPVTVDGKTETWLIQFKNETHNHPTEIEPFGGAATCLGGAIRDPLSGRAYVYQAMRVTGAGDPTLPLSETLEHKLPQKKIVTEAAQGYSSYGNQIGLATGQVTELYDPGYVAKRMEIGAVVGASPKKNVKRETPEKGDIIVLLGGRTGRDGCGGATGSSKAHNSSSIDTCGAEVQKGNPPTERKLQRLFRNGDVASMIKRCNDFGAGGVCVAIGELAPGLIIDLNKVPKKYEGLDGTELAVSESQERMAVVLDKADADRFIAEANKENLEATVVAEVTDDNRLTMDWCGNKIVDLSREFLDTNGVTSVAEAKITAPTEADYRTAVPSEVEGNGFADAMKANISRLNVCSQRGLVERFDASIGAGTVLMPYAGKYQMSEETAMVAKIPLTSGETDDATAFAYGYIPGVAKFSPFHSAAFAVVESMSKLLAAGANPLKCRLTFQEYFERLYGKPERFGKPAAALLGAFTAQEALGVPSIGGKDSMSGSFNELDVPPTLVSFAISMTKASKTVSSCFGQAGKNVYLVPVPTDRYDMPDYDKLKKIYEDGFKMADNGKIYAASVVKEGGAAAAIAKMCFGSRIGFEFENGLDSVTLYAPLEGSLVIAADSCDLYGAKLLGKTSANEEITMGGESVSLCELEKAYVSRLEPVFRTSAKEPDINFPIENYTERNSAAPAIKAARPRVVIPVFPGTNCEVDTARAFENAGADADIMIVNNLSPANIEQAVDELEAKIKSAQIVMLPGGFSGGDEPDGSGKFIATTFRNPKIADAVNDLLKNRDGLMLGICNGFQALIKLGLVPYGEIRELDENAPTLTFNTIGRHISRMAYTTVTSVKSPWLAGVNVGDVHTVPISHGEGRFVADEATVRALAANGQITFRYCDFDGNVTGDSFWNPNGSVCAVEGICSPDGRVLGKMGHSERMGENICKNVPGNHDQLLFESGVKYFK